MTTLLGRHCGMLLLALGLVWSQARAHVQTQPPSSGPLTIITEEWPPYNYAEEGRLKGVAVAIVQRLLQELGRDDVIRIYPGERAKRILDATPRTLFFALFRTPERESQYQWIGPIGSDVIYFYQRKGDSRTIDSLEAARQVSLIACRQSGLVYDTLKRAGFTNLDSNAHSGNQVYLKLLRGRTDLAISDSPLGVTYFLRQMGLPADSLKQTSVQLVSSQLYIAGTLDIPAAEIARWQQALLKLKADGTLERLYREFE